MGLRIRIRKHQHVDYTTSTPTNVEVVCNNVGGTYFATFSPATISNPWIDVTEDTEGFEDFELIFKEGENGLKSREKSSTSMLKIVGESATIVKDWVLGTPCSMLNYWDCEITDEDCNITYENFELKPDNIEWCETEDGEECSIEMPLREMDKKKSALQKVIMTDDWQGWFNGKGGTNNSLKRNFHTTEVVIHNTPIQHGLSIGFPLFVLGFFTIPNPFGSPIGLGTLIGGLFGFDESINKSLGFGYFHPIPTIRELLENACGKLGITLHSSVPFNVGNVLEHDCIFYPRGGEYHRKTNAECFSNDLTFKWNNRDLTTLEDFLNEICKVYRAKWTLVNNTLYFNFIKDSFTLSPIYTITEYDNLCKSFSFKKRKGYGDYRYTVDPADQRSNTVEIAYNDIVDYDGATSNALLEGKQDNRVQFAPTSFWGDGFGENYLEESTYYGKMVAIALYGIVWLMVAIMEVQFLFPATGGGIGAVVVTFPAQLVFLAALLVVFGISITSIYDIVSDIRDRFAYDSCHRGAIELYGTGEVSVPRIIRKNPTNPMNQARVVETAASTIVKNPRYNTNNVDWKNQFNGGYNYLLSGGGTWNKDTAFNFPLFFDANYLGELFNTYHEKVDNGMFVNDTNESRKFEIPLCCDTLTSLGLDDENTYAIGKVVELNGEKIIIEEISVKYGTYLIEIKGKKII